MTNIILGKNQYGKAEVRVVRVTRDTDRHEIEDLNVTSQLRGDLDSAHFEGNNEHVVPTDTQKNTVYAFAKDGVGSPEEFPAGDESRRAENAQRPRFLRGREIGGFGFRRGGLADHVARYADYLD